MSNAEAAKIDREIEERRQKSEALFNPGHHRRSEGRQFNLAAPLFQEEEEGDEEQEEEGGEDAVAVAAAASSEREEPPDESEEEEKSQSQSQSEVTNPMASPARYPSENFAQPRPRTASRAS